MKSTSLQPKKSMPILTAETLKDALWETLQELRNGEIQPGQGDAIAAQAREIVRTVKAQLQITTQAKRAVPQRLITFAEE